MTVAELKNRLLGVPDNTDVFIKQNNFEFSIAYVSDAKIVKATFVEDSGPVKAKADVFVLADEKL